LEITQALGFTQARIKYRELSNYSFIMSSDAHYLKDIGGTATKIVLKEPTFAELKMALAGQNGRHILEQPRI
jgi:hypothetical protein